MFKEIIIKLAGYHFWSVNFNIMTQWNYRTTMYGDLHPMAILKYIDSVTSFPVNIKLCYNLNWDQPLVVFIRLSLILLFLLYNFQIDEWPYVEYNILDSFSIRITWLHIIIFIWSRYWCAYRRLQLDLTVKSSYRTSR